MWEEGRCVFLRDKLRKREVEKSASECVGDNRTLSVSWLGEPWASLKNEATYSMLSTISTWISIRVGESIEDHFADDSTVVQFLSMGYVQPFFSTLGVQIV